MPVSKSKSPTNNSKKDSNEPDPTAAAAADTKTKPPNNNDAVENSGGGEGGDDVAETDSAQQSKDRKLYKSPRFRGYLIMFLSSIINYHGVFVSNTAITEVHVTASTRIQQQYGYVAAVISCMVSGFCVLCHLDGCSCLANAWKNKLFARKSKFETTLAALLLLWWFMAVIIQTRSNGIAGDAKGQYNIYFSTWCCFFCAVSIFETKMMEHDLPSVKTFIKSWPHRAPGWIAILVADSVTLFWYVDIYVTYDVSSKRKREVDPMLALYYGSISDTQYELLIFIAAATLIPSSAFVFMEIFRDSSDGQKGSVETYIEAFCLFTLACAWIPAVCVATTPGGFATQIGNSWFFTWVTCFFVTETLLWFVFDSRGALNQKIVRKEQEYLQHQKDVLAAAQEMAGDSSLLGGSHPRLEVEENLQHVSNNGDSSSSRILGPSGDFSSEPPSQQRSVAFQMNDVSEDDDESADDTVKREMRMKEANRTAYFDALDDILQ